MAMTRKIRWPVVVAAFLLAGWSGGSVAGPLKFKQVFVGFDGPSRNEANHFDSADAVRKSWIAGALEPRQLADLLAKVEFRHQMVVVMAIGEFEASTGSVIIDAVETGGSVMTITGPESTDAGGLLVRVRVGVPEAGCKYTRRTSYPFAIVIAEKPDKLEKGAGYDRYNFPDGCKGIRTGQPHEAARR
jgi:hypothetical protein